MRLEVFEVLKCVVTVVGGPLLGIQWDIFFSIYQLVIYKTALKLVIVGSVAESKKLTNQMW